MTISFRAFRDEKKLSPEQIIDGCASINEIQHRILMRILPTPKLNAEQTDFLISEISRHAEKEKTLSSHVGAALNSARRRTRDELKDGGREF